MSDDFKFKNIGPGIYTVSGTLTMLPGKNYEFKLISAPESDKSDKSVLALEVNETTAPALNTSWKTNLRKKH